MRAHSLGVQEPKRSCTLYLAAMSVELSIDRSLIYPYPTPTSAYSCMAPRIRAWQIAGIVLILAVCGLLLYAYWPTLTGEDEEGARELAEGVPDAKANIQVVVVMPSDFTLRSEATGHLAAWRRAEISAEAQGVILERPIEEGQVVQEGELLLRVDDRDQTIALQEAEAAVLKARADYAVNLDRSDTLSEADTTELALARTELLQAQQAFDRGSITQAELHEVRRRFEANEVLVGGLRGAVQAVTAGLTQAEQQLERARLENSRTRIVAPFRGRVADLQVEAGQRISPGQTVLTLLEDDRMKVAVDVLEADLVGMRVGATAQVRLPNLDDRRFTGRIYSVNPLVDPKTGAGRVTVTLPNPRGQLVVGLYAEVALETERLTGRLVVPADAVLVRQSRDLVFRMVDGKAYWTYVTVGERSGDFVEIVDGLSPGDSVAIQGHYALSHDALVNITQVQEITAW